MKLILKKKQSIPLSIKLMVLLFIFIGIISFILTVQFSDESNPVPPDLKQDRSIATPRCSMSPGFYSTPFVLTLSSSDGYKIYYTLDGSEPSLKSTIYTHPILVYDKSEARNNLSVIPTSPRWKPPVENVFKGTSLRAICVLKTKKSEELVSTFFVNEKGIARYTLPVIALTINQVDFFDFKTGIYVMGKNYEDKRDYIRKNLPLNLPWWEYPSNYLKRGTNSERIAHFEFFDAVNKQEQFQSNVGLRINGNATRGYSQKSLRIIFNEKYGNDQLNYSLFSSTGSHIYKTLVLRNGGNDWDKTMFRDVLMQSLMSGSRLDVQNYLPAIVFINGEYWGIHNVCERMDENYLSNKYNMSTDSLTILEYDNDLFYGDKKDKIAFKKLLDFVSTHDMSVEDNYLYLKKNIDIKSFVDCIIANVYFCNSDWPNNNVRFWRYQQDSIASDSLGFRDGRWRWMLYDTDWGFGYTGAEAVKMNLFKRAKTIGSVGILFSSLLKNKIFCEEFKTRFQYHLDHTFNKEMVINKIDEFEKVFEPEINEHINRWRSIGSYGNWKEYVEELRIFAVERPKIQIQQLNEFYDNNKTFKK